MRQLLRSSPTQRACGCRELRYIELRSCRVCWSASSGISSSRCSSNSARLSPAVQQVHPQVCRAAAVDDVAEQQQQQQKLLQQQQQQQQQAVQLVPVVDPQQQQQQQQQHADAQQQLSFSHRHGLYDSQGRLMLKNLTLPELQEWCTAVGEEPRRALQIWRWLYYDGNLLASLQDALGRQNGFSQRFIDKACQLASVDGGLLLEQVAAAKDGTTKLVFKLTEGEGAGGSVEAVLIPMLHRRGLRKHITLCVSSQVGCAMNCQFCYTGRMGLSGNLSTAQIIEQMVVACRVLAADPAADASITNVVFMGMGEPLHNYEAVMAAVDIMCQPLGLHMSHNKVTVSTVGLVDVLERFAASSNVQLALSLHATTDEVRDWIVPVNRRHNLAALTAVLRQHYGTGNAAGRRVLVEYTMLSGVNDTLQDAQRLVQLLEGVDAKVNLIMFNPFLGTRFKQSSAEQVLAFRSVLIQAGRICTIRDSRGDDGMAACGQLGNPALSSKAAPILPPPPRFEHVLA